MCLLTLTAALGGAVASAQVASPEDAAPARIQYSVELKDAARHLLHVRVQLPPGTSQREVALPVWNATYMVRDFAQYVNHVHAESAANGRALPLRQLTGSSWRVWGAERGALVEYDTALDIAGPFGAQYNDHHAFLNLALVLMYSPEARTTPVALEITGIPACWQVATPMPSAEADLPGCNGPAGTTRTRRFSAASYDRMVDSPVEIGSFRQTTFEDGGAGYTVVVDADPADYDLEAIAGVLHRIVATETAWMNDRPFTHYMFIYHFPRGPAGGGMEHAYGTAIDATASRVKDPNGIGDMSAHEFFHLWNVKRIRPQSLEPVDYTREQYSRALWFSEGVTSTVGNYTLLRTGIWDEKRFLGGLARAIGELNAAPAHRTMSPEESSLTTWFDKYPNYHDAERSVSYYTQGDVLGVLLDLAMLDATNGQKGLRELLQYLNQQYARQGRFFDDSAGVRDAAEVLTGRSFKEFFEKYVAGTEQIPYDNYFKTVGLRLERKVVKGVDRGFAFGRGPGQPAGLVSAVTSGSAAEKAGLRVGDVVTLVNGAAVTPTTMRDVQGMEPGDTLRLKITRSGREQELSFALGSRDEEQSELVDTDPVTPEQRTRRAIWLGQQPAAGAPAQ